MNTMIAKMATSTCLAICLVLTISNLSSGLVRREKLNLYRGEAEAVGPEVAANTKCISKVRGPPGRAGPPGEKGEPGGVIEAVPNWKTCQWWMTNDQGNNKQVWSCNFTKQYEDTFLYVQMSANLRVRNYNETACCRWFFKFNGKECNRPANIDGVVFANGYEAVNLHRPRVIMGYCRKPIPVGLVDVEFWVGNCAGYEYYDCSTGWNSAAHMIIEEVTPSPYS